MIFPSGSPQDLSLISQSIAKTSSVLRIAVSLSCDIEFEILSFFHSCCQVCPFTQSTNVAATGLEKVGVEPGAIGYPHSRATSLLHIMGAMWRAVDEMLSVSPAEISTVLLLLPCYAQDDHPRFAAASNVLARSLTSIGVRPQLRS